MWFLLIGVLLLASGCGPTPSQVLEKHRPAYVKQRSRLQEVLALLPAAGTVVDRPAEQPLDPPFVFSLDTKREDNNADAIMAEQLEDARKAVPLDLLMSRSLDTALSWTQEDRGDDSLSSGDPEFMERVLADGTKIRYLVVHRNVNLQLPVAIDDQTYMPGGVTIEGFVVDLQAMKIIATYVVTAEVPASVEYAVGDGEDAKQRLEAFAQSGIWSDARKQIKRKLAEVTGGEVEGL